MKNFIFALLLTSLSACVSSKNDKLVGKILTGSVDQNKVYNKDVVHVFRAIGQPSAEFKHNDKVYYKWQHSRRKGVNYLTAGIANDVYCYITIESKKQKIQYLTWYGSDCDVYVESLNSYFKKYLNINLIEEESKQENQTTQEEK